MSLMFKKGDQAIIKKVDDGDESRGIHVGDICTITEDSVLPIAYFEKSRQRHMIMQEQAALFQAE